MGDEETGVWVPYTDDLILQVKPRWDGQDYTADEFIKDRAGAVLELSSQYDRLAAVTAGTNELLGQVATPKWTGAAANAVGRYVTATRSLISEVGAACHEAKLACLRQQPDMQAAYRAAGSAATAANDARSKRRAAVAELDKQLSEAKDDHFLNPFENWDVHNAHNRVKDAENAMSEALADATVAQKRNRAALDALISGLDRPDNTLANLTQPTLPDAATIADPRERALLRALVDPIATALAGAGDTERAQDARTAWAQAMRDDPTGKKAKQLLDQWAGELTGPELDWVLNHVDETELATTLGTFNPMTDRELYNKIAAKASRETLDRLADTDPNHYWHPVIGSDFTWGDPAHPATGVPAADLDNLHQGMLGDCVPISTLGAITARDPQFLPEHVKLNDNGTYTVTLYKDGKPVEVTVTPEVPFADGKPAFAQGDSLTLFQIYEKALAQSQGELNPASGSGYQGVGDGSGTEGYLTTITGREVEHHPSPSLTPEQLNEALQAGRPAIVNAPGGNGPLYDPKHVPHLYGGHEYYVESVDTSSNPPTVTIVNPWGRQSTTDGTVRLTWDEFTHNTGETIIAK